MTPLFDVELPAVNDITGDDLRVAVHRHLMQHPMLTAFEVARALHLPHPNGGGSARVRHQLRLMEDDGEALAHELPRTASDHRPAVRWEAT